MLLATVLSAILMAAVLAVLAGLSRDRAAMKQVSRPTAVPVAGLIAFDLQHARTYAATGDVVLELVGNNGIDRRTRRPDGRLVRVTYRQAAGQLWRQQEYLDDPARPDAWQDLAATGFAGLTFDPPPADVQTAVPAVQNFEVVAPTPAKREVRR